MGSCNIKLLFTLTYRKYLQLLLCPTGDVCITRIDIVVNGDGSGVVVSVAVVSSVLVAVDINVVNGVVIGFGVGVCFDVSVAVVDRVAVTVVGCCLTC